jgi:hypothetical protein
VTGNRSQKSSQRKEEEEEEKGKTGQISKMEGK